MDYESEQNSAYDAYEADPLGTTAAISAYAAQQAAENAVASYAIVAEQNRLSAEATRELDQRMAGRYPDWNQRKAAVGAYIAQNPGSVPEHEPLTSPAWDKALSAAYRRTRGESPIFDEVMDVPSGNYRDLFS